MPALTTLDAWLAYIEGLHPKTIDLTLERVRAVAARLTLNLGCLVFIVGGTNGKGSTCALLDAILRAAGYRVGLHTSPHLLRFNERAVVDGVPVADDVLMAHLAAVESARGDITLTYFEFTTLAIVRLFQHARLDVAVLEVGLGGRFDAVNMIDADCAIITSIDLDHVDYLGPTRERIAFEKAHIYRADRPAICSDPSPPETLIEVATALGADLWRFGRDFHYQSLPAERGPQQWRYVGRTQSRAGLPFPALRGANQLLNAAGALAALEALAPRLPVSQQAVREGLTGVTLPARFQVLPGRPVVILDVAHNPHAAAVLAQNLDSQGYFPATHAVFGMLRDKDVAGVVDRLRNKIDFWHVGPTAGSRGLDDEAAAAIVGAGVGKIEEGSTARITRYPTIAQAYGGALACAGADDRIVVLGSFLTVADVLHARASGE